MRVLRYSRNDGPTYSVQLPEWMIKLVVRAMIRDHRRNPDTTTLKVS